MISNPERHLVPLRTESNRIDNVPIEQPGQFQIILEDLSISRRSDGQRFWVPTFLASELLTITNANVADRAAMISLEPGGIDQVSLFNASEHCPLADRELRFSVNTSTFGVKADKKGTFTFLGSPMLCRMELDPNTGVTILPL